MQDWQPVRMTKSHLDDACKYERSIFLKKMEDKYAGRIIRVRPVGLGAKGEQMFEVHPDDLDLIEAHWYQRLCEHQIMAD